MATPHGTSLLIDDGGAAALLAGFLQEADSLAHVWFSWTQGPSMSSRLAATKRHASILGASWSQSDCPWPDTTDQSETITGFMESRVLLAAGQTAVSRGCTRVIWPIALGDDIELMSRAVDRARLIEHVWNLDMTGDRAGLLLELPLVDLMPPQLADLAQDLQIPLGDTWDCLLGEEKPCGACPGCLDVADVHAGRGVIAIGPHSTPLSSD
jgi:Queuosine biosynthesis protein QueC